MRDSTQQPYKVFGKQLRDLREAAKETVAEVSGAVEIDTDALQRIEAGQELPSEEILFLLINHFKISEQQALKLWELAGYDRQQDKTQDDIAQAIKQMMVFVPLDNKVAYTDKASITANDAGVTVDFMQGNTQHPVARIGMSKQFAKNLVTMLVRSIKQQEAASKPRMLPPSTQEKKPKGS